MYKNIEFVCTGNSGRSPLAEAIAKKYLHQLLGKHPIKISSSGTKVDYIKAQGDISQTLKEFIPVGLEKGLLSQEEADCIVQGKQINEIYEGVSYRIEMNEESNRRIIVRERELGDYIDLNRKPIQTIARPEAEVILPVDQVNYVRVKDIYLPSGLNPIIGPLGEIKDPFLSKLGEFRVIVDKLAEATINTLWKYL